jgi:hypothetical protein
MGRINIRRVSALAVVVMWATVGRVAVSQAPPFTSPDTSTAAVVEAAVAYITEYEQQLTAVVATEISTQQILRQAPVVVGAPRSRTLKSEIFFMFSPAEHEWMAVRDVGDVDGRPVENPPDLKTALSSLPLAQVAFTLKRYSSRFNIGRIVRNFGEPTLSLLVLDSNHRANFLFDRTRVERKSDAVLVTLTFHEIGLPTLIRDLLGNRVLSEGVLVVEAGSGRVRQAVLRARMGSVQAELTTTYARDARLGLWVPAVFRESYEDGLPVGVTTSPSTAQYESMLCEAKYTNFRRFEAYGRIK